MQASDIILGLLIILLVGWVVILSVQIQGLDLDLQSLEAKQVAQGIQVSPDKCSQMPGYRLVKGTQIVEKEYLTTVGFNPDQNQVYFCFYEQ